MSWIPFEYSRQQCPCSLIVRSHIYSYISISIWICSNVRIYVICMEKLYYVCTNIFSGEGWLSLSLCTNHVLTRLCECQMNFICRYVWMVCVPCRDGDQCTDYYAHQNVSQRMSVKKNSKNGHSDKWWLDGFFKHTRILHAQGPLYLKASWTHFHYVNSSTKMFCWLFHSDEKCCCYYYFFHYCCCYPNNKSGHWIIICVSFSLLPYHLHIVLKTRGGIPYRIIIYL